MILYHGSKTIVKNPITKGSKPYNDYGPSFYLTLDLNAAKSWACKNDEAGIVNKYEIRSDAFAKLKILDLTNKDEYSLLNWVAILIHFKELDPDIIEENIEAIEWLNNFYIDVDKYDVIIGFRADDSYWLFPEEFIKNNLSFEDLGNVYMLGDLGIQYAFMSERAIKLLKFVDAIECEESFVGLHKNIVKEASKQFTNIIHQRKTTSKTYILDLIRKEYDKRR